jgi:WD40 repeat protein
MRTRSLIASVLLTLIGVFLIYAGQASAQVKSEAIRVITLSKSGYEQAHGLAFSSDGKVLAVGGQSGIYLYDSQKLSEISYIQTDTRARSVAFVPGTEILAAGLFDNTVKFWDISSNQLTKTIDGPGGWVRTVSISADGSLIASASDDETLRVWQVADGAPVLVIDKNTSGLRAVSISPDGKLAAGALGDNTVRVWSVPDGRLVYTLSGHTDWVRNLAFSPDGQLLASGSFDSNIMLWNMQDGSLYKTLKGHTSSILGMAFSPDGQTLASGDVDSTVRLWNVRDGSTIRMLQGHAGFVYSVAFSPDGKTLASGGEDNTVKLWDLDVYGKAVPGDNLTGPVINADCRQCHHRRGQVEPARVIELSCAGCHTGGIGSSWCAAFPRSASVKPGNVHYKAVGDNLGLPVLDRGMAVVIASPGNGETLYVRGDFMAPEVISGRVFTAERQTLSGMEIHLDILSGGQKTASLVTHPTENGDFLFNVAINPNSPPPHLSRPGTRQCLVCHGDFTPEAGLPKGDVRLVVTAVTPEGRQSSDERWIHVDNSRTAAVQVQVLDNKTHKPLPGLTVEASTLLYHWRDRFGGMTMDANGNGQLNLEALSQSLTAYNLSIPHQVVNGMLYASMEPAQLTLEAGASSHPTIVLAADAQSGKIMGNLGGGKATDNLQGIKVWALQLPAGPVFQTSSDAQGDFVFGDIPVSQYLVLPDPAELAQQNLSATASTVDLFGAPVSNVSISAAEARPLSGKVSAQDGGFLPFAWLNPGDQGRLPGADPSSGNYLIPDLAKAAYVTALAPGYYALPQSVAPDQKNLDFRLVARPETQHIAWGTGSITVPPETKLSLKDLEFNLESGWLWGQGGAASQPALIHLAGLDISIPSGKFAIEYPSEGQAWLYIYEGNAQVSFIGQPSVQVTAGQMLALQAGAAPLALDSSVAGAYHPSLEQALLAEIVEPTLRARIQSQLVKTGIGAMQMVTLVTYVLALVTIIAIPLIGIFLYRKKRQIPLHEQEKY